MSKVSTVAIVDEQPAEVFRQLYLRELGMRFKAAAINAGEPKEDAGSDATFDSLEGDQESEELTAADFVPYDATSLDERHTDDWLQTASSPEALDRSLRRLDEQARLSMEEQGVNTLFLALGMLHYKESTDSEETIRAPLVLLPVTLGRKSARTGYTLRAGDDEPIVNPALAEYLRSMGIELPTLPDAGSITEAYDLQSLLSQVSELIRGRQGWSVKTEIYLGLFSFQKFVMYKDLDANAPNLRAHRLIKQLVTRKGQYDDVVGLPSDIAAMQLDRDFPPEETFQVVDADSSQLRAIAAVAREHDLVIEGPPGTGKSQTITNLIAAALAAGKSVLFVAEKMAALSVVHERLQRAKLGEFCLALHSTKANKRAVMQELAATLDASLQRVAASTTSTQRLPEVRATLTNYVQALHTPLGSLGLTPYRVFGALGRVLEAPRVNYRGPVDDVVSPQQLERTARDLRDLAAAAQGVGVPASHPWRGAAKTFYSEDDILAAVDLGREVATRIGEITRQAEGLRSRYSLPAVIHFSDVDIVSSVAAVLARSPGAPIEVLVSDAWNRPPREAKELIQWGRDLADLRARITARFTDEALQQDHAGDIEYVERKAESIWRFLAFLDGRHRSIKKRWLRYRKAEYGATLVDQANDLKRVDEYRSQATRLRAGEPSARALFGDLWEGEQSEWPELERYVEWVVELRGLCVRHGLERRALEVASSPAPDLSSVAQLRETVTAARAALAELMGVVGWPEDYFATTRLAEIKERALAVSATAHLAPAWAAFEAARQEPQGHWPPTFCHSHSMDISHSRSWNPRFCVPST
jgi:hypothetical protein